MLERAERTAKNVLAEAAVAGRPPYHDDALVLCRDGASENDWYRIVVTNGVVYFVCGAGKVDMATCARGGRLWYNVRYR